MSLELDQKMVQDDFVCYVDIQDNAMVYKKYPFLSRFDGSSGKINEYLGYHFVDFQSPKSSADLNFILNVAKKRGDW